MTVGDFWSWAYSDLLSNGNRSVLGEFLVAAALGVIDRPRVEWDVVDLRYREKGIEVKTSGYLQSWSVQHSRSVSRVVFSIARSRPWDATINVYGSEPVRSSECYVFCVYTELEHDRAHANILDLSKWEFYIMPTSEIDARWGNQKRIVLGELRKACSPVDFSHLRQSIDKALGLADGPNVADDQ